MKLNFSKAADSDLKFWRTADRKQFAKIAELLHEIAETPFTGRGKPEPLMGNLSGCWSRRINSKDRIVYRVDEQAEEVFVYSLRKHYGQ